MNPDQVAVDAGRFGCPRLGRFAAEARNMTGSQKEAAALFFEALQGDVPNGTSHIDEAIAVLSFGRRLRRRAHLVSCVQDLRESGSIRPLLPEARRMASNCEPALRPDWRTGEPGLQRCHVSFARGRLLAAALARAERGEEMPRRGAAWPCPETLGDVDGGTFYWSPRLRHPEILRHAFAVAARHGCERVVWCLPFLEDLSELELDLRHYLQAHGWEGPLPERDYSGSPDNEDPERHDQTSTWNAPLVITTHAKLLRTLLGPSVWDYSRMLRVVDSLLVIHLPNLVWPAWTVSCLRMMAALGEIAGTRVLFTGPAEPAMTLLDWLDFDPAAVPLDAAIPAGRAKVHRGPLPGDGGTESWIALHHARKQAVEQGIATGVDYLSHGGMQPVHRRQQQRHPEVKSVSGTAQAATQQYFDRAFSMVLPLDLLHHLAFFAHDRTVRLIQLDDPVQHDLTSVVLGILGIDERTPDGHEVVIDQATLRRYSQHFVDDIRERGNTPSRFIRDAHYDKITFADGDRVPCVALDDEGRSDQILAKVRQGMPRALAALLISVKRALANQLPPERLGRKPVIREYDERSGAGPNS